MQNMTSLFLGPLEIGIVVMVVIAAVLYFIVKKAVENANK